MNTEQKVQEPTYVDRDEAIRRIRAGLKRRTGKSWSVRGGRGTAWGWIRVCAPPSRLVAGSSFMTDEDTDLLSKALGERVHGQGLSIPSSSLYREAYVQRAETGSTELRPEPYWD